jgi:hypothetical protein
LCSLFLPILGAVQIIPLEPGEEKANPVPVEVDQHSISCHPVIDRVALARILRTGKKTRPKTAIKGKRYHCAI